MTEKEKKKICQACGGTGQVSFFKGVSRFLLTSEECELCSGTGYILDTADEEAEDATAEKFGRKPAKK